MGRVRGGDSRVGNVSIRGKECGGYGLRRRGEMGG